MMRGRKSDQSSNSPPGNRGRLYVISGPSGVGKDAVLARIRLLDRPFYFTITATTRRIRPGEENGVDYIFLDRRKFKQMIEAGDLLEWAEVYGNLYGVPKSQVIEAQKRGFDVIMKVDVQGAATIKKLMPEATLIFLEPPDISALKRRLRIRNTESEHEFRLKLEVARDEMKEAGRFDHVVVNHDDGIDAAADAIDQIIRDYAEGRFPADRNSLR